MQMTNIAYSAKFEENIFKTLIMEPPIHHRASHWGSFTAGFSIYQKTSNAYRIEMLSQ